MGIVALAQVFLIPPMLHVHLHLWIHTGEAWEPADKKFSFGSPGVLDGKRLFVFFQASPIKKALYVTNHYIFISERLLYHFLR